MGVLGRLQGIVHFIENPCNEPWMVYVEAAVPWANKAAMQILGVDLMQSVRTGLNPGELRTKRHSRGGYNSEDSHKGTRVGMPDPYEYIGHHYHEAIGGFIDANATAGTRAIWQVTNMVERGMWEYFLLDVGSNFLYHSLADARRSKYCRRPYSGDAMRSGPHVSLGVLGWQAMAVGPLKYSNFPMQLSPARATVSNDFVGSVNMYGSFSGVAVAGTGQQLAGARIQNVTTGEVVSQDGPYPVTTGQTVEFVLAGSCKCGETLEFALFSQLGSLVGEGIIWATFSGAAKPHPKPPIPPKRNNRPSRPPRRPKRNVYQTTDGTTVYQMPHLQHLTPPKKPKP